MSPPNGPSRTTNCSSSNGAHYRNYHLMLAANSSGGLADCRRVFFFKVTLYPHPLRNCAKTLNINPTRLNLDLVFGYIEQMISFRALAKPVSNAPSSAFYPPRYYNLSFKSGSRTPNPCQYDPPNWRLYLWL